MLTQSLNLLQDSSYIFNCIMIIPNAPRIGYVCDECRCIWWEGHVHIVESAILVNQLRLDVRVAAMSTDMTENGEVYTKVMVDR